MLVGLALAYFAYRHDLPLTLRSALYPVLKDKIYGPWGHVVDLIGVFGTIFGLATSLGRGITPIPIILLLMAYGMVKTLHDHFTLPDVEDKRELEYLNR